MALLEALRKMLSSTIVSRVIGLTPSFLPGHLRSPAHPGCPARENECRIWLQANGRESELWLALDDDPDAFCATAPVARGNYRVGLTEEQIAQIRQWIEAVAEMSGGEPVTTASMGIVQRCHFEAALVFDPSMEEIVSTSITFAGVVRHNGR